MEQLNLLTGEPDITWFEVSKLPSVDWLYQYAYKLFCKDLECLSDTQIVDAWKAAAIANYCVRKNKMPRGHDSANHIIYQIGAPDILLFAEQEMERRNLASQYGLDIDLSQ